MGGSGFFSPQAQGFVLHGLHVVQHLGPLRTGDAFYLQGQWGGLQTQAHSTVHAHLPLGAQAVEHLKRGQVFGP